MATKTPTRKAAAKATPAPRKPRATSRKATAPKAEQPAPEPARVEDVELTDDVIAGWDPTTRINNARPERDALAAWRAAGSVPADRPSTPIIDWMSDPTTKPARRSKGTATPTRDGDQESTMLALITEGRQAGESFKSIADKLNAAGIPTARGVPWTDRSTWTKAKRLGLVA